MRHGGLEPGEIAVFGDDADPAGAWRPRAAAIRQRLMRSESDGHCYPTSFPGLAAREAARRRDLAPVILSICDRYRPTVADFLRHVDELRIEAHWDKLRVPPRSRASPQPTAGSTTSTGTAPSGMCSSHPDIPGLRFPMSSPPTHASSTPTSPTSTQPSVAVVGAGMAAATEWLNALAAGAEVVSIRRREPARQPLNVARPLFTKRGLASLPRDAARPTRAELLRTFGEPSLSARPGVGRSARGRRPRRPLSRRDGAQRRPAGDLRNGIPPRLPARSTPLPARRRARARDGGPLDRARRRLDGPDAHRCDTDVVARRACPHQWAFPGRGHARRDEGRRAAVSAEGGIVSYTLRGRGAETRLAAAALPVLIAALLSPVLHVWWPIELAGLMLGIGLALDVDSTTGSFPTSLAGPLCRSGCSSWPDDGDRAAARCQGAGLSRGCVLRGVVAPRRRFSPTRAFRCSGSSSPEDGGELGRAGIRSLWPRRWRASPPGTAWARSHPSRLPAGVDEAARARPPADADRPDAAPSSAAAS